MLTNVTDEALVRRAHPTILLKTSVFISVHLRFQLFNKPCKPKTPYNSRSAL